MRWIAGPPATTAVVRVGLQIGALVAAQGGGNVWTGADVVQADLGGHTRVATGAAMDVGPERSFTAVAGVTVAVPEPGITGKRTRAATAARRTGVGRSGANVATAATVRQVNVRVRAQQAASRPATVARRCLPATLVVFVTAALRPSRFCRASQRQQDADKTSESAPA